MKENNKRNLAREASASAAGKKKKRVVTSRSSSEIEICEEQSTNPRVWTAECLFPTKSPFNLELRQTSSQEFEATFGQRQFRLTPFAYSSSREFAFDYTETPDDQARVLGLRILPEEYLEFKELFKKALQLLDLSSLPQDLALLKLKHTTSNVEDFIMHHPAGNQAVSQAVPSAQTSDQGSNSTQTIPIYSELFLKLKEPARLLIANSSGARRSKAINSILRLLKDGEMRREIFSVVGEEIVGYYGCGLPADSDKLPRGLPLGMVKILRMELTRDKLIGSPSPEAGSLFIDYARSQADDSNDAVETEIWREFFRNRVFTNVLDNTFGVGSECSIGLQHFGLDPHCDLLVGGDIPSKVFLPQSIARAIAHLPSKQHSKWIQKEKLAHQAELQESDHPFGVGPGFLRPHLVTAEWLSHNPLWQGEGKGLFKGSQSPKTPEEFTGCIIYLLCELFRVGKQRKIVIEDTFAVRLASLVCPKLKDGVQFAVLQDQVLNKQLGALILLMTLLLDKVLPQNATTPVSVPTKRKSFWAHRLVPPLLKSWQEWRNLGEFKITWDATESSKHDPKQGDGLEPDGELFPVVSH